MAYEHHRRRAGSSRRDGSIVGLTSGERNRRRSGSVLSRVFGSFRHRHHEDKTSQQQRDWMASYEEKHRPDRPKVDKRLYSKKDDEDYADEILRMQERNRQQYKSSEQIQRDQEPTKQSQQRAPSPHPTNVTVPNFSYSSKSPKGTRQSMPSPAFAQTEWRTRRNGSIPATGRETLSRARAPSSPVSPGAITIQVYHASEPTRRPIVRHTSEPEKDLTLLPRKAYNPNESSPERRTRESRRRGEKKLSERRANKSVAQRPQQSSRAFPDSKTTTGLGLIPDSSPAAPPAASDPTPTPAGAKNDRISSPAPASQPRTCVMPGCDAALVTDLDREQNVCEDCRDEYRQSAFDDVSAIKAVDLQALQALIGGSDDDLNAHMRVAARQEEAEEEVAQPRLVNGNGKGKVSAAAESGFKLQPAPAGRRFRPQPRSRSGSHSRPRSRSGSGSGSRSGSGLGTRAGQQQNHSHSREKKTEGVRKVSPPSGPSSSSLDRGCHIGFQDARWIGSAHQQHQHQQQQEKKLPALRRRPGVMQFSAAEEHRDEEQSGAEGEGEGEGEVEKNVSLRTNSHSNGSGSGSGSGSGNGSWMTDARSTLSSSSEDESPSQHSYLSPPPLSSPSKPRRVTLAASADARPIEPQPDPESEFEAGPEAEANFNPYRATLLYRQIEEIIDCYTSVDSMTAEQNARRKESAVAEYWVREPEEVYMRRMGFI
ncbi:hypothetical protein GGR54DRAFT_74127 [Hypoxylon sp. NC1633]|nr:hypothetical protein GGR54DRAFT_74127 [Hypoxylon sp. NC1633]